MVDRIPTVPLVDHRLLTVFPREAERVTHMENAAGTPLRGEAVASRAASQTHRERGTRPGAPPFVAIGARATA